MRLSLSNILLIPLCISAAGNSSLISTPSLSDSTTSGPGFHSKFLPADVLCSGAKHPRSHNEMHVFAFLQTTLNRKTMVVPAIPLRLWGPRIYPQTIVLEACKPNNVHPFCLFVEYHPCR